MKIALACRVYPTHRPGGMPFVVQDRARALSKLGHQVCVLTTGHPTQSEVSDDGVSVCHLQCKPQAYSADWAKACLAFCKRWSPDIVHCDSFDVSHRWWLDLSCPVACTLHGFSWGGLLTSWNLFLLGLASAPAMQANKMKAERDALKKFSSVLAISKHEYHLLRHFAVIPNVSLVYNPIPDYFFRPSVEVPNSRDFLCAAISNGDKRLFSLAAAAVKQAGGSLRTCSRVPRTQMPQVYDEVRAVLVPSAFGQGYDLTIAEALSRRRPVIVSDVGSAVLEAEDTPGIVVTHLGDRQSLMEALAGPLPTVPATAADRFRSQYHAERWLEVLT